MHAASSGLGGADGDPQGGRNPRGRGGTPGGTLGGAEENLRGRVPEGRGGEKRLRGEGRRRETGETIPPRSFRAGKWTKKYWPCRVGGLTFVHTVLGRGSSVWPLRWQGSAFTSWQEGALGGS